MFNLIDLKQYLSFNDNLFSFPNLTVQKCIPRRVCNLSVPIPNRQTLVKHCKLKLVVKTERDVVYKDPIRHLIP